MRFIGASYGKERDENCEAPPIVLVCCCCCTIEVSEEEVTNKVK
jgi:hypothetical protein